MMNDLPDVAGSLFTNQYKAVKIEGKRLKPNALEGTGSVRTLRPPNCIAFQEQCCFACCTNSIADADRKLMLVFGVHCT